MRNFINNNKVYFGIIECCHVDSEQRPFSPACLLNHISEILSVSTGVLLG